MPWIANTSAEGGTFGVTGKHWWFRPDGSAAADFNEISLPSGVHGVDAKPTWSLYDGSFYGVGGWTDNLVFTADFGLWELGIRPPTFVPTVANVAGPGITGEVICYVSWWDEVAQERSPLSAPSATLTPLNERISWTSLPTTAPNARITHIELWRSVDGGLPRLVMRRQIGVSSVVEAVATGSLGEAFTEDFAKFPRCRFGTTWHERLVMAGDDEHPDTLYLSLIGLPERYSGLTLRTKTRQPIVGLFVVNDQLIVVCPRASERVSGFTEDDLSIEIAQPEIGALNHHGIEIIHGLAWIPTHLGPYVSTGMSWFFIGEDIQTRWTEELALRRTAYEAGWGQHDPVTQVYKFYVGEHTDTEGNTFWVADYSTVVPQVGGSYSQPAWSYDVSTRSYESGAILAVPGGRQWYSYLGACNGRIYREALSDGTDDDRTDAGDAFDKRLTVRHGADSFSDVGGDVAHGKRYTDIDVFVETEVPTTTINLFGANEWGYLMETPSYTIDIPPQALTQDIYIMLPETKQHLELPQVVGEMLTVELIASEPTGWSYRGYGVSWKEGPAPRMPKNDDGGPI